MNAAEGPTWSEFTGDLATTLYELPSGAKLVIGSSGNRYAQFAMEDGELYADISGDDVVDEEWRMSESDHEALRAAGWAAPDQSAPNWHRAVFPRQADAELLAERVVDALHGRLRITSPSDLTPDGWVDGEGLDNSGLDVTGLGLGPGKIDKSNATIAVYWYLLDRDGHPPTTSTPTRIDTGWVVSARSGAPPEPSGRPEGAGTAEFYVADDHTVEPRPHNVPASTFQMDFEKRYRERNGLTS